MKASSSVTLMTSPQGCHESVCSGPVLPHSMCVCEMALFFSFTEFLCVLKRALVGWRQKGEVEVNTFSDKLIC